MTVEIISWSISTKVWYWAGIELATPGSAVRHASVARHITDCATRPGVSNNMICATSKASDQPAHMHSLIRDFASGLNILWVLSYWPNTILEFLSLKGGCTGSSGSTLDKMPHRWKSHVAAQLCLNCQYHEFKPAYALLYLSHQQTVMAQTIICLWTYIQSIKDQNELWHEISSNVVCATSKVQISLRICTLWLEPLLVFWLFYEC